MPLDLRHTPVDQQFDTCDVAAVIGGEEDRDFGDLVAGLGQGDPAVGRSSGCGALVIQSTCTSMSPETDAALNYRNCPCDIPAVSHPYAHPVRAQK
jgi:hypothetical protein